MKIGTRGFVVRSASVAMAAILLSGVVGASVVGAGSARAATPPASRTAAAGTWWVPPLGNQPWQWELSNPLDLANNAKQMGTADKLPDGGTAPAPVIYDIDGIINPASTVAALHALGKHVVCYVEVGAAGNYYTAADEGIATTYYDQLAAAGVLGGAVQRLARALPRHPVTGHGVDRRVDDRPAVRGQGIRRRRDRHRRVVRGRPTASA